MIRITTTYLVRGPQIELIPDGPLEARTDESTRNYVTFLKPGPYVTGNIVAQTPFMGSLELAWEEPA